jgi:hypothetical protein
MATFGREGSANSLDGAGGVHGSGLGRRLHEIQMVLRNVAARNEHAAQPIVPKTYAKRRAVLPILLRWESPVGRQFGRGMTFFGGHPVLNVGCPTYIVDWLERTPLISFPFNKRTAE